MELESITILAGLIFTAAILYSSVGHAGASGYLAAMALFGMAPLEMKPAALILNILVALIALTKYLKVGRFSWPIFWPFALSSIPFAYLGGNDPSAQHVLQTNYWGNTCLCSGSLRERCGEARLQY